jgi:hypothetical protein
MPQTTLDGKRDCHGVKGTCQVKIVGDPPQLPELLNGLEKTAEKYPCVKITVNKKSLKDFKRGREGDS